MMNKGTDNWRRESRVQSHCISHTLTEWATRVDAPAFLCIGRGPARIKSSPASFFIVFAISFVDILFSAC